MVKAARFSRFGGPEVLDIVDLPDPHPGPGQVRIVVRAAGVNPSDWKKREGLMDPELPQTMGRVRKRSMTPLLRSVLSPTAVPIADVVRFSASRPAMAKSV